MRLKNSKCLVLNSDYTPLAVIGWQKALIWSIKKEQNKKIGIEIIDFYKNDYIIGVNKNYPIPAVVKTVRYFRLHNQKVSFSRKNLFIRDNFTCQYCGIQYAKNHLTYDHVIPKSRHIGNKKSATSWTNIVTACLRCNAKKANKTPEEANMMLLKEPIQPKYSTLYLPWDKDFHNIGISGASYTEWEPFIGHLKNENRY